MFGNHTKKANSGLEIVNGISPPPQGYPFTNEAAIERFTKSFENSAKRWELVVYPSLIAFIILAGYGFFLVYSLTSDVAILAKAIDPRMSENMSRLATSVEHLSSNIDTMTNDMMAIDMTMQMMSRRIDEMSGNLNTLGPMLNNIGEINQSVNTMAKAMTHMQRDTFNMNNNITPPMRFMNSFVPW